MTLAARASVGRALCIFVAHPSKFLTDHRANGDGLVAFGFLRELAIRGHEIHVAVDRADLNEALPTNVHLYQMPLRMPPGPLRHLEYMVHVRALLQRLQRSVQFDVIHQLNPVTTGLSLAFLGMHLPLVLGTYVGAWPEPPARSRVRALLGSVTALAKRAVALAQQTQADVLLVTGEAALRDRIVIGADDRSKVLRQKHGVDIAHFRPAADRLRAHNEQKILFVASLARKKGIYVLLDALPEVLRQCPSARLIVAGGGVELANLQGHAKRLELSSAIDFLGTVDRSDIAKLMRESAVFCLPSYGEPYATSVIEALASGLPIVVTDSGGVAEIIDDLGGTKVRTGDSHELAAALVDILRRPEEALRMSEHNRLRAEKEYAWPRVGDALEMAYRTVLAKRDGKVPLAKHVG